MDFNKLIQDLVLGNAGKSSFANIVTGTNPVKVQKSRLTKLTLEQTFGHSAIVKLGERNVSIGNSYQTAVNNRLDKVGISDFEFTSSPRTWGTRVGNSALIEHKGEMYLEYFYLNANKSSSTYVWEDGSELSSEELDKARVEFFAPPSKSIKQADAGLTDENMVLINTVKCENIYSLHAFGVKLERRLQIVTA